MAGGVASILLPRAEAEAGAEPTPSTGVELRPSKGVELTFEPERLTQCSGGIGFDTAAARAHEAHGYSRSV